MQPARGAGALGGRASTILRKGASDGTEVILLPARDVDALRAAIVNLALGVPDK